MSTIRTFLLVLAFLAAERATELAMGQSDKSTTPEARPKEKSALAPGDKNKESKAEKKHRGKFTISKETTYVTEPLDKDGYIDYASALNKRLRQGVTAENNANVLIWKALGPHPDGTTLGPEFCKLMGMQVPLENGEYFKDLDWVLKERLKIDPQKSKDAEQFYDRFDGIIQRAWTSKQHPDLAAWLEVNAKPLALTIEATKRAQYYSPMVTSKGSKGSGGLIEAL